MKCDFINSHLGIHDQRSLEQKFSYFFDNQKKTNEYQIENYFFIPKNLGINSSTYPKTLFYNRLQNYVRFKTPSIPLTDLPLTGEKSPLDRLLKSANRLRANLLDPHAMNSYERDAKLFGAIVRSSLRDHAVFIRDFDPAPHDLSRLINDFDSSCRNLMAELQKLWDHICIPGMPEKVQKCFLWMEEAVIISINENCYFLLETLKSRKLPDFQSIYLPLLLNLVKENLSHKQAKCFVAPPSRESDNENFVFRKGVLKKFISSPLFLDVDIHDESIRMEHLLFAVAAGIAMFFATVSAYYFSQKYSGISLPFIVAAVCVYMIKDRMKALGQVYFKKIIDKYYYDHGINIFVPGNRKPIGNCREYVRFVRSRELPEKISLFRQQSDLHRLHQDLVGENILLYRKKVSLHTSEITQIFSNMDAVNDILRINIREFMHKMDNPVATVYVPEEQNYIKVSGDKVYYLHLITRIICQGSEKIQHFRIVINRIGLKRIEEIPLLHSGS